MEEPKRQDSADNKRINVNEEHQVRYWTAALNVTPDELKRAVQAVGPLEEDVRAHFSKKKWFPWTTRS